MSDGSFITSQEEFSARLEAGQDKLIEIANHISGLVNDCLQSFHKIRKQLNGRIPVTGLQASHDIKDQLDELIYPGFVSETPLDWLEQYPRYLKAIEKRLDKLQHAPDKDRKLTLEIAPLWQNYLDYLESHEDYTTELQEYRWLIEELRVSLFAQELKTIKPVSVKRLEKLWKDIKQS